MLSLQRTVVWVLQVAARQSIRFEGFGRGEDGGVLILRLNTGAL